MLINLTSLRDIFPWTHLKKCLVTFNFGSVVDESRLPFLFALLFYYNPVRHKEPDKNRQETLREN